MRILILLLTVLLSTGCTTKHETDANVERIGSWERANKNRTYSPVTISGVQKIEGENITITTLQEHNELKAPDMQYDTSDTDLAKTAIGVAGAVVGAKIFADSQKVQVVEQPAPVIVKQPAPVVVQ